MDLMGKGLLIWLSAEATATFLEVLKPRGETADDVLDGGRGGDRRVGTRAVGPRAARTVARGDAT